MKYEKYIPKKYTRLLLRITLPILVVFFVAVLISYLDARAIDPVGANLRYPAYVEYILSSCVLAAMGAFMASIMERRVDK